MKVLGIESAGTVASVALVEENKIICEYLLNDKHTHSKTIMPMLDSIKSLLGLDLNTIDLIAVSGGPGSYTGLRIGSSTAKGLAHVLDVPIVGVSTIESLAGNIFTEEVVIAPMLDARRQHVFSGAYKRVNGQLENLVEIDLRSVEDFCSAIVELGLPIVVLGDGVKSHRELLKQYLSEVEWTEAEPLLRYPRASTLALVGLDKYHAGEVEDYLHHQPDYYRLSQAERELKEKS